LAGWDERRRQNHFALDVWGNWRLNFVMALYLVVRHPQNPHQTFANRWENDELLTSIQTTIEIANLCTEARAQNQWVYIHRCGYNGVEPKICCAVHVADVEEAGGWIIVTFRDQTGLTPPNSTPREPPPPDDGDNSYDDRSRL